MNYGMIFATEISSDTWVKIKDAVVGWCLSMGKNILIALLVLFIGNKIVKWVIKLINKTITKSKMEPIVGKFLLSLIKFGLYAVLAVVIVGIVGIPATSFIAMLSAASITIGLALQGSLSNFAGGVLILLFKPFRIGDYIKEDVHGNEGVVTGIDLFYTKILTPDNKAIVIPNGALANNSVTNYTALEKRRVDIEVGISYDSDMKKAKDVINGVIATQEDILKDEPCVVAVSELAASQVTICVKVWVKTSDYWTAKWNLTENIKRALDDNNIEIPFNQLSVTLKNSKEE